MSSIKLISSNKIFSGFQKVYSHESTSLKCTMKFAIYLPKTEKEKLPVIYWLSGLTCTEQNFITKSGFQRYASHYGIAVVAPDTSPRGVSIPGEDDSYDFGSGAGFYVDATQEPWKTNYQMYTYITSELPEVINSNFPVDPSSVSIMGHSMGGHGALVCYLRNHFKYRCVSTFSAICNPCEAPWGKKAFTGYLGSNMEDWEQYDATKLVSKFEGAPFAILLDQGEDDEFLDKGQLLPKNFFEACKNAQVPVILNMRHGYDHSYYYIATYIGEHIAYHAKHLLGEDCVPEILQL